MTSVSTVYRTEASDSLCFKFLDGLCTTVIEVKILESRIWNSIKRYKSAN